MTKLVKECQRLDKKFGLRPGTTATLHKRWTGLNAVVAELWTCRSEAEEVGSNLPEGWSVVRGLDYTHIEDGQAERHHSWIIRGPGLTLLRQGHQGMGWHGVLNDWKMALSDAKSWALGELMDSLR
jgi:hypothetical protein